jgi:hypothetical protein
VRITRLQVKDFRRYRDLDIELAPGLTVLRGPNEAGKSTLQRVIEIALTRKVTSTSGDLDAVRPWGATDDSRPWIRLEFVSEDEDAVRHGSLEKSFLGAKGVTTLDIDGDTTTDPAEADARGTDRHPDRGVLPVHRIGPSSRDGRPRPRRIGAPGPAPGVDQRRRSRDVRGQEEARQGDAGAEQGRRQEPRAPEGRR